MSWSAIASALKAIVAAIGGLAIWDYGKKTERVKQRDAELEAVNEARKASNRIDFDPDYRKRVRDKYRK